MITKWWVDDMEIENKPISYQSQIEKTVVINRIVSDIKLLMELFANNLAKHDLRKIDEFTFLLEELK